MRGTPVPSSIDTFSLVVIRKVFRFSLPLKTLIICYFLLQLSRGLRKGTAFWPGLGFTRQDGNNWPDLPFLFDFCIMTFSIIIILDLIKYCRIRLSALKGPGSRCSLSFICLSRRQSSGSSSPTLSNQFSNKLKRFFTCHS